MGPARGVHRQWVMVMLLLPHVATGLTIEAAGATFPSVLYKNALYAYTFIQDAEFTYASIG